MLSSIDKAWVTAGVGFLAMTSARFFGFDIDAGLQAAIVAVIMGVVTWVVPNKEPE